MTVTFESLFGWPPPNPDIHFGVTFESLSGQPGSVAGMPITQGSGQSLERAAHGNCSGELCGSGRTLFCELFMRFLAAKSSLEIEGRKYAKLSPEFRRIFRLSPDPPIYCFCRFPCFFVFRSRCFFFWAFFLFFFPRISGVLRREKPLSFSGFPLLFFIKNARAGGSESLEKFRLNFTLWDFGHKTTNRG